MALLMISSNFVRLSAFRYLATDVINNILLVNSKRQKFPCNVTRILILLLTFGRHRLFYHFLIVQFTTTCFIN